MDLRVLIRFHFVRSDGDGQTRLSYDLDSAKQDKRKESQKRKASTAIRLQQVLQEEWALSKVFLS